MNPDANSPSQFTLPPPMDSGQGPAAAATPPLPELPLTPLQAKQEMAVMEQAGTAAAQTSGDDAGETALDKHWVTETKRVVAQTHADPYEQSRQLTVLKTDYLQKRYGKVLGGQAG